MKTKSTKEILDTITSYQNKLKSEDNIIIPNKNQINEQKNITSNQNTIIKNEIKTVFSNQNMIKNEGNIAFSNISKINNQQNTVFSNLNNIKNQDNTVFSNLNKIKTENSAVINENPNKTINEDANKYFTKDLNEENPILLDKLANIRYYNLEIIFDSFYPLTSLAIAKNTSKEERIARKIKDKSFTYGEIVFKIFLYYFILKVSRHLSQWHIFSNIYAV